MEQQYQISDSELEIMQIIWRNGGESRFGPLLEELVGRGREWKSNTVLTFLARLVEKGVLRVEKQGRLNIYHARLTERDYLEGQTQSFVSRVYHGSAKELVAALLRQDSLTPQDLDELRGFWKEAKANE